MQTRLGSDCSKRNSVDPDQTAPDLSLHCLPLRLHLLDSLLYARATLFKFKDNYSNISNVQIFRNFTAVFPGNIASKAGFLMTWLK